LIFPDGNCVSCKIYNRHLNTVDISECKLKIHEVAGKIFTDAMDNVLDHSQSNTSTCFHDPCAYGRTRSYNSCQTKGQKEWMEKCKLLYKLKGNWSKGSTVKLSTAKHNRLKTMLLSWVTLQGAWHHFSVEQNKNLVTAEVSLWDRASEEWEP
jgi:hypothetical protein